MAVDLSDDDLMGLRMKLKSGDYDCADIMRAWISIDELIELRGEVEDLQCELRECREAIDTQL